MKTIKLPIVILLCVLLSACGNSDSKKKDSKTGVKAEMQFSYILDDLLVYDSHEEVFSAGFRVHKGTWGHNDVITGYYSKMYTPDKSSIIWKWKDSTYTQLESISVTNKHGESDWKTKSGHTLEISYNDWVTQNKKPVLVYKSKGFNGLSGLHVDWNGGDLANTNIRIAIQTADKKPISLMKFRGQPAYSNDPYISNKSFKTHKLTLLKQ